MTAWNPNYVAYAASRGNTPEAQLAADREAHPDAPMLDFMAFIAVKHAEFRAAQPDDRHDHDAFSAWLGGGKA